MFNWTNSQDVYDPDIKPLLTEMGPYVFREYYNRTNITLNDNGTITYQQLRRWEFLADLSNGSLDDEITHLNVISNVRFSVISLKTFVNCKFEVVIGLFRRTRSLHSINDQNCLKFNSRVLSSIYITISVN